MGAGQQLRASWAEAEQKLPATHSLAHPCTNVLDPFDAIGGSSFNTWAAKSPTRPMQPMQEGPQEGVGADGGYKERAGELEKSRFSQGGGGCEIESGYKAGGDNEGGEGDEGGEGTEEGRAAAWGRSAHGLFTAEQSAPSLSAWTLKGLMAPRRALWPMQSMQLMQPMQEGGFPRPTSREGSTTDSDESAGPMQPNLLRAAHAQSTSGSWRGEGEKQEGRRYSGDGDLCLSSPSIERCPHPEAPMRPSSPPPLILHPFHPLAALDSHSTLPALPPDRPTSPPPLFLHPSFSPADPYSPPQLPPCSYSASALDTPPQLPPCIFTLPCTPLSPLSTPSGRLAQALFCSHYPM